MKEEFEGKMILKEKKGLNTRFEMWCRCEEVVLVKVRIVVAGRKVNDR